MRQQLESGRAVTNVELYRSVVASRLRSEDRERRRGRLVRVAEVAGAVFGGERGRSWTEFVAADSEFSSAMAEAANTTTREEIGQMAEIRLQHQQQQGDGQPNTAQSVKRSHLFFSD